MKTSFLAACLILMSVSCAHNTPTFVPSPQIRLTVDTSGICIVATSTPGGTWKEFKRQNFNAKNLLYSAVWLDLPHWIGPTVLVAISRVPEGETQKDHVSIVGMTLRSKFMEQQREDGKTPLILEEAEDSKGYHSVIAFRDKNGLDAYRIRLRSMPLSADGRGYAIHIVGAWDTPWDDAIKNQVEEMAAQISFCRPQ